MVSNRKFIFALLMMLGLLSFVAAWVIRDWKHFESFPKIISAYYAKEFCSCYFVMEQTENYCHDWTRQWIPISDFKLDVERKRVEVEGLFVTTSARWLGERKGCVLE